MLALYRRFRPQRFAELVGQDLIATTLRNAVRDQAVTHAYLLSGPRGTGKTSSARILAKALNCAAAQDGEPCNSCASCQAITNGASLDVVEMDAASNRGIDAMRDLIGRVALATPGRWKVYIVDEVHMLTTEAANTLLKTLEEPPSHVVFVLATTDPQKVLPTIRSRTQHFEFHLLPYQVLADHLTDVASRAALDVSADAIEMATRRGAGSARDALSALDQIAAAGGLVEETGLDATAAAEVLAERNSAGAITWVNGHIMRGLDPRQLARELIDYLRLAFLATIDTSGLGLDDERAQAFAAQGARLGRAGCVRALAVLGQALIDMRDAPDARIVLEVAMLRLCHAELDTSIEAVLERLERLESASPLPASAGSSAAGRPPAPAPHPRPSAPPLAAPPAVPPTVAPAAPRVAPGPPVAPPRPTATERAEPAPSAPIGAGATSTLEEITAVWPEVLAALSAGARARLRPGRFVSASAGEATFSLPNAAHAQRCADFHDEMARAVSARLGRPVEVRLVAPGAGHEPDSTPSAPPTTAERVLQAFGGAVVEG